MHCHSDPDLPVSGRKSTSSEALSVVRHRSTDSESTKRHYVRGSDTAPTTSGHHCKSKTIPTAKSVQVQRASTSVPLGRVKVPPLPKLIESSEPPQAMKSFPSCSRVASIHTRSSIHNSECALHSNSCSWSGRGSKCLLCIPPCIDRTSTS